MGHSMLSYEIALNPMAAIFGIFTFSANIEAK